MAEKPQSRDVDINDAFRSDSQVGLDESDRLKLARQVLMGMAAICIGVFVGYASYPDNKALVDIFELIKIGALPLITLIVSFYFPNSAK
ncbi:hypothetical protein [Methylomonas sp. CM2]|uniref:hypothetical protein n=1 Tax=Methylomonas sp. CM2 TaxID=3417647 RepID=UPI003CF7DD86